MLDLYNFKEETLEIKSLWVANAVSKPVLIGFV